MSWTARRTVLAGLAAFALAVSAVGPCHCLLSAAACHREVQEPDAHACCDSPSGLQAVADECCDSSPELVMASTDVPEVAPPSLLTGVVGPVHPGERSTPVAAVRTPLPPSLDRTTVLLI
jgi:hypothetical protein